MLQRQMREVEQLIEESKKVIDDEEEEDEEDSDDNHINLLNGNNQRPHKSDN